MVDVPEPNPREYTDDEIRKIVARYKQRNKGKLPYPDQVSVPPLRNPQPSAIEKIWANRYNLVRHFIVDGGGAAIAAFTATKDLTVAGAAFVVGGVVGAARKGIDDGRRASGKTDMVSSLLRRRTEGDALSIRSNVYEVQDKFAAIGIKLTDDIPNKDQLTELLGDAVGLVTESVDFKDIPQDERAKAIAHALIGAGNKVLDAQVYSDENPTP